MADPSSRDALFALLAARRGLAAGTGPVGATTVPRRAADAEVPLLPGQRQLWFLDRLGARDGVYTMAQCWRLSGELDHVALRAALAAVLVRHEALRAGFTEVAGEPVQHFAPADTPVPLIELDAHGSAAVAAELVARELGRPFDLTDPPLVRAILVRVGEAEHVFALGVHHIVCDGPSLGTVLTDLGDAYRAVLGGRRPWLDEPEVRFGDVAAWRAGRATEDAMAAHARFWTGHLAGAPLLLDLPADRPRGQTQTFRGAAHPFAMSKQDTKTVAEFCAKEGITPFPLLLAAYATVLARYAGCADLVLGVPMREETVPGVRGCVGMLVNTVALRVRPRAGLTVRELIGEVRASSIDALEHQDYPLELLARQVGARDPGHHPVFQVMFVLNPAGGDVELPGLAVRPVTLPTSAARFDLTFALTQQDGQLAGQLDYATDLFDAETVGRLGEHLHRVITAMISDPEQLVDEIDLLTDEEWALVRAGGHVAPPRPASPTTLTELVAGQAAATPDAVAVRDADGRLTYRDLLTDADRLAWRLHRAGCRPDTVVGLGLRAGRAALTGLVGILRAGSAYLPVDPAHPRERLAALFADAGAGIVVTDAAHRDAFGWFDGEVLVLDELPAAPAGPPPIAAGPDDLAYLIYTSGSTGTPKGVAVTHATAANLTRSFIADHGFLAGHRVLMVPPLTFDASVGDVFPVLASGAELVVCENPAELTGPGLLRLCAERRITMVDTASALWQKWVDDLRVAPPDQPTAGPLTTMMVGGEAVPVASVRDWAALTGGSVSLVNHYGPTEATVCATTYHTVDATELADGRQLPIGRPLPHVRVYVLDERQRPVPIGVPGELCVGGAALARGYHGLPQATADRFVPDPYAAGPSADGPRARLYRTGDLVRWHKGTLHFLGRLDRQVKIRGHRIEPAEVEAACRSHPAVRDALVLARPAPAQHESAQQESAQQESAQQILVGYLVRRPGATEPEQAALRAHVRAQLPDYLVPSAFVLLDELPLTGNGKVDLAALPAPEERPSAPYVAPDTTVGLRLAELWAARFGREQVGVDDDFFELGGHSLAAAAMVTAVRAEFGIDLPLRGVFEHSTLGAFTALVAARLTGDGGDRPTGVGVAAAGGPVDLWAEAVLPDDIRPAFGDRAAALRRAGVPRSVFLTGATGFLGAYLLAELLRRTSATVHCLVRADTAADAMARIERTLRGYRLWRPTDTHRIMPVVGDLGAPMLGMAAARFDTISAHADVIYHCGGQVNFALSYQDLKSANVDGTLDVLRMASRHRPTPVNLVSTLGVFPLDRADTVSETDPPDEPAALHRGYEQSKWVSDELARAARRRGLPVAVHRPARVTGDSRTGIGPPDDLFGNELRAVALLGSLPAGEAEDMAPVDHVAGAIVHLGTRPDSYGRDFHHYNGSTLPTEVTARTLREFGYPVRTLPYAQWYAELTERTAGSDDRALLTIAAMAPPVAEPRLRRFDCAATEAAVAAGGLVCPPADAELLRRYLLHYVHSGHLPAPVPGRPGERRA